MKKVLTIVDKHFNDYALFEERMNSLFELIANLQWDKEPVQLYFNKNCKQFLSKYNAKLAHINFTKNSEIDIVLNDFVKIQDQVLVFYNANKRTKFVNNVINKALDAVNRPCVYHQVKEFKI